MSNYRTKKYTRGVKPLSNARINQIRKSALNKATTAQQERFIKSNNFNKLLRQNVRDNRYKQNVNTLKTISRKLADTSQRRKIVKQLFGEVTTRKNGKPVTRNSFTSVNQTNRLNKIKRQIDNGTFNMKRYVTRNQKFKSNKKYLPSNASAGQMLDSLDRTDFYYEQKTTIKTHNTNVKKHGVLSATKMNAGKKLSKEHDIWKNKEDEDFLQGILNIKK